jgi:hypothetical protein
MQSQRIVKPQRIVKRSAPTGRDLASRSNAVDTEFRSIRLLVLIAVVVAAIVETFTPLGTRAHADTEAPVDQSATRAIQAPHP